MLERLRTPEGRVDEEEILRAITVVGSYPPRRCGIATFSADLLDALRAALPEARVSAIAINDVAGGYTYPPEVQFEIDHDEPLEYDRAAAHLSMNGTDVVCLQHEFGIFGGTDGAHVVRFLQSLNVPIVTTLHTILPSPTPSQLRITQLLDRSSDRFIVMCETARALLEDVFDVSPEKIDVIPHGVPDVPFLDSVYYKDRIGAKGRRVLMSFGLLSPDKGFEYVIQALPEIRKQHPDVLYVVVGATHPHILRRDGEAYRRSLMELARKLGVEENVVFHNRFVSLEELIEFLEGADIYITPYVKEMQVCSGTLSYALACGKAVVSTPYLYAAEMLGQGRGSMVPFRDAQGIARAVVALLDDPAKMFAMRKAGYELMRKHVWAETAERYAEVFRRAVGDRLAHPRRVVVPRIDSPHHGLVAPNFRHLLRMTDDVGILQHASLAIPLRSEGYCTDDNARALMVATWGSRAIDDQKHLVELAGRYLAFLLHAFDSSTGRFRNFMAYDRRFTDDARDTSDAHARALWGLGVAYAKAKEESQRVVAARLLQESLPAALRFEALRPMAYALLGLDAYLERFPGDTGVKRARACLALRLFEHFEQNAKPAWPWPEDQLTYANAVLPHALLLAGKGLGRQDMVEAALRALGWLCSVQTSHGSFEPVGNRGWFVRGGVKARFDQQPIEAESTLRACADTFSATGDRRWANEAKRAFDWFLGQNDLGIALYDAESGGSRDGLNADGVNPNRGAESTLSWLSSLLRMLGLRAEGALDVSRSTERAVV
jgi:glycosyltransferase involved in cell wall biosynthesis